MSITPKTDSQLLTVKDGSYVAPHPEGEYVTAEFARELEREVADLHSELAKLREDNWELLNLAHVWEFAWGDKLTPQSLAILKEVTARTALRENARIERIKARKEYKETQS